MQQEHERRMTVELSQIITAYLTEKTGTGTISTDEAVQAVRKRMPSSDLTKRELVDLIVKSAIEKGFAISFDSNSDG